MSGKARSGKRRRASGGGLSSFPMGYEGSAERKMVKTVCEVQTKGEGKVAPKI